MDGTYFADSFYWIALAHPRDAFHANAIAWSRANRGARIVTTEEVLIEVLNWFAGRGAAGRLSASSVVHDVWADPLIQVVPQTTAGFRAALAFYESRQDKSYSLTDCRSMLVMKELGVSDALTNDHHFTQEGLTIIFP